MKNCKFIITSRCQMNVKYFDVTGAICLESEKYNIR